MNFEEHAAKPLLRAAGIETPKGEIARSANAAAQIVESIGAAVVKAQVPTGKRGKAGGIALVSSPQEAQSEAARILQLQIGDHEVSSLLIEEQVGIEKEYYLAILNDSASKGPLLLFSSEGGMDIEEIAEAHPQALTRIELDIRSEPDLAFFKDRLPDVAEIGGDQLAELAHKLYGCYQTIDAELLEINPLVLTTKGSLMALDCKYTLDDSAIKRQPDLAEQGTPDKLTELEEKAKALNLKYIELDGNVGVLANGAGLTMTSMDAIRHYGGEPANFLEIGGESYRYGKEALELVLSKPGVKSLLVNFCGAFARTDVMTEGLIEAWETLKPEVPVFFTIHGTGEDEAIDMVRTRLGLDSYDVMDDAVKAAVEAAS